MCTSKRQIPREFYVTGTKPRPHGLRTPLTAVVFTWVFHMSAFAAVAAPSSAMPRNAAAVVYPNATQLFPEFYQPSGTVDFYRPRPLVPVPCGGAGGPSGANVYTKFSCGYNLG